MHSGQRTLFIICLTLVFLSVAAARINYRRFASHSVPEGSGYPVDREGTVFGSELGTNYIHFAGGVNTLIPNEDSFTAFTDIFTYDTVNNVFTKAQPSLPGPSFFGAGGFAHGSLVIYSGRTNTQPTPWTYFADMYLVNFTKSMTAPSVRTVKLNPSVTGRSFHSASTFRNSLYVFGGSTGPDGTTPIDPQELFLAIDIRNGNVTKLPCTANCPSWAPISPAMYLDTSEELIYLYSGMSSDFTTWGDNTHIYIFDIIENEWKDPVSVKYRNNFVYNGLSPTLQREHELLIIGGDYGSTGSHSDSFMLDLMQNPPQVVSIDHGKLTQRCESLTFVGVDAKGNLWAYGGATYANSSALTALSYCHGVVTMEYYQDPDRVGAGTKWFAGISMALVTAAIIGTLVYLYKKNSARRDYIEIP